MTQAFNRILTVDSESRIRTEITTYLEDNGFVVIQAENGPQALELFAANPPDLVLSELNLPGLSGLELLTAMTRQAAEIPVIMVSQVDEINSAMQALRLGAWDYIIKPITEMTVLEHAICKALERSRLLQENRIYREKLEQLNLQLSHSLQQLEQDQEAGRYVQAQLLPQNHYQVAEYCFSYRLIPSLYVSGDFIDYFKIDAQNIGFYIADVSGHGAAAAFITILLKSSISQMLADFKAGYQMSILQPHQVLALLNESLAKLNLGKYLTIVYAVLNIKTNKLRYSIGGHHPMPILCSEDSCEFLQGNGFAIGIMAPNSFNELVIQLPNAFNLILFSDGILEVLPQQGLKAQQAYLLDLMRLPNLAIEEIWDKTGIMRHDPLPDDIACLLLNKVSVHGKW